jgi:iron(III) transport system permease protein
VIGVTVGLPLFVLVWTSVSPFVQVPSIAGLKTLTFRWYGAVAEDPMAVRGFVNTAILGTGTALAVLVLSLVVGWIVVRSKARLRAVLDLVAFAPIAIPGIVVGLGLMWLYLTLPVPIYGTLWILWIAFVTRFIPYGARLAYAGFSQLHPELDEAAYVCGSSWAKTMRTVSLPLLAPTLTVGAIYTIVRAFRELGASLVLAAFEREPYSLVAYHMWTAGEGGKTAAYGVVAIAVVTVMVASVRRLAGRRDVLE